MWPPRSPPPTKPSRSDRQRPGETAGERRRGRRYGADVPTLTGPDFVLTSGAQVAPTCGAVAGGPRRASGARASAAVGAMAVLVLRSRSSCCHRLSVERPPLHAPTRRHPATLPYKAVAPATPRRRESTGRGGVPPPTWPSRSDPQHSRRGKEAPMPAGGRRPGPAGGHATCPHREQPPSSPICGRHPLGQPDPARDPGRSQSKENHPTASARVPSPGNNCCFTPRPASKDDKKHKAILQREINHTALLLTEAAKLFNDATPQPSPTKPSR